MKGLQGERLRQAFKYFDQDEDGFIRPDQFKRAAFLRDGGNAVLVGVGANHSMKSGQAIKVQDLVSW